MSRFPTGAFAALSLLLLNAAPSTAVGSDGSPSQEPVSTEFASKMTVDEQPAYTGAATTDLSGDSIDIAGFRRSITRLENSQGAYSAELPEELLALGRLLQEQGRHAEAIDVFKRGTHLSRINDGLESSSQIPFLQGEIRSQVARGQLKKADQRYSYLHRIQWGVLPPGRRRADALTHYADWQYQAFELEVGEQYFTRLVTMWNLHRLALNDLLEIEGENSPALLPPLYGMLKANYLMSNFTGDDSAGMSSQNTGYMAQERQREFRAFRSQAYKNGEAIIDAIYDIQKERALDEPASPAEALVLQGDWMLWHGRREAASEAYRRAFGELADLDDAQSHIDTVFGEPVPLPAISGIEPLPSPLPPEDADVILEFGVNQYGRVVDLERLDDRSSGSANRFMRKLRATPFRPRFEEGEAVETRKVVRAYDLHD